jgi:hypothetical protein
MSGSDDFCPVLKITMRVQIGSESSLLYSILCAVSRKGFRPVLLRSDAFGPWIYHVFITAFRVLQHMRRCVPQQASLLCQKSGSPRGESLASVGG